MVTAPPRTMVVSCDSLVVLGGALSKYIYLVTPPRTTLTFHHFNTYMLHKCLLARTINQCKNFVFESGHTEKTNENNIVGLFGEGPLEKK